MSSTLTATQVLPTQPEIFAITIDNVFSSEECDELIQKSEDRGYEQALVNVGGGLQILNTDFRNNDRCIIDTEEFAEELFNRIKQFIPTTWREKWEVVELNERMRYLRYGPEQEFKPHRDGNFIRIDGPKKSDTSFITLQVYLNDVEKGGETSFFLGRENDESRTIKVNPRKGMVILFQHNILHSGSPVIKGKKYVIRTDVMYRDLSK